MLKKNVKWTDYNGVERSEDFYFNLSKAEVLEMEMSTEGGLAERIQKIVDAKDMPSIVRVFKDLVLKAYGKKSDNGRNFIKSKELTDDFVGTEAYSIIFMELATDAEAASAFINGIVPADMSRKQVPDKN